MIKILLFAGLKEKTGASQLEWTELPITVIELKQRLKSGVIGLENIDQVMIAVNESYADDELIIHDGDVVALIPPVSGG